MQLLLELPLQDMMFYNLGELNIYFLTFIKIFNFSCSLQCLEFKCVIDEVLLLLWFFFTQKLHTSILM